MWPLTNPDMLNMTGNLPGSEVAQVYEQTVTTDDKEQVSDQTWEEAIWKPRCIKSVYFREGDR